MLFQNFMILCVVLRSAFALDMSFMDVESGVVHQAAYALDVDVAHGRGARSLLLADPMASHDWTSTDVMQRSARAVSTAVACGRGAMFDKVRALEAELTPAFNALPKNAHGRLESGSARYMLQRLFAARHGWSVKGLGPAGDVWTEEMAEDEDVRQVNKYVVPSLVQLHVNSTSGAAGIDLRAAARMAATLEHIARADDTERLEAVYRALGLATASERNAVQAQEVLRVFLLVYAFGINLEFSSLRDVQQATAYLDKEHEGWLDTLTLIPEALRAASPKEASTGFTFSAMRHAAWELGHRYSSRQQLICARAKAQFAAAPGLKDGYLSLSEANASGFISDHSAERLARLGALEGGGSRLVVSNYLLSSAMCLTTASYYEVCCPNECDSRMQELERRSGAATASLEVVQAALSDGDSFMAALGEDLAALAAEGGGVVTLHGRAFAAWMHRAYPMECPAPIDSASVWSLAPKTPNEWMAASPSMDDKLTSIARAVRDTGNILHRYVTAGKEESLRSLLGNEMVEEIVEIEAPEEITEADARQEPDEPRAAPRVEAAILPILVVQMGAMVSICSFVVYGFKSGRATLKGRAIKLGEISKCCDDFRFLRPLPPAS